MIAPLNTGLLQVAAIAIAVLLEIVPAGARTPGNDSEAARATQISTTSNPKAKAKAKDESPPPSVFERCKREAQGLRGPERSNFMTNCLKKRKTISR